MINVTMMAPPLKGWGGDLTNELVGIILLLADEIGLEKWSEALAFVSGHPTTQQIDNFMEDMARTIWPETLNPPTEDLQYYTPKLEDLFVGYECQIKRHKEAGFEPSLINAADFEFLMRMIKEGNANIRTPYLSIPDIERLGWQRKADTQTGVFNFRRPGYHLTVNLAIQQCAIFVGDIGIRTVFSGWVPSINELRQVHRLTNITKEAKHG